MLEGLILGVFLMTAQQAAPPPAAPADLQTSSSAAGDPAASDSASAPATTDTPADAAPVEQPAPAATTNTNEENRVRCHRGPPEIGSIMGRRICSTRAQDRQRAEHDGDRLNQMQNMQNNNTMNGSLTGNN